MNGVQDPFSRLVVALDPWLDQVVIIGGWAHQLYRRHPAAQELDYPPLTTLDTDVAVPLKLPVREQDIRARLLAHGFTEEFLGDDRPPATHYHPGDEASGFYVEFLTPMIGGEYNRKGRRKATTEVAGVASQRLRHVELLLHHPWSIDFKSEEFAGKIQIANPVSFVAQSGGLSIRFHSSVWVVRPRKIVRATAGLLDRGCCGRQIGESPPAATLYEYFHGDNGAGIGASHQTGWTALVAKLIQQSGV